MRKGRCEHKEPRRHATQTSGIDGLARDVPAEPAHSETDTCPSSAHGASECLAAARLSRILDVSTDARLRQSVTVARIPVLALRTCETLPSESDRLTVTPVRADEPNQKRRDVE